MKLKNPFIIAAVGVALVLVAYLVFFKNNKKSIGQTFFGAKPTMPAKPKEPLVVGREINSYKDIQGAPIQRGDYGAVVTDLKERMNATVELIGNPNLGYQTESTSNVWDDISCHNCEIMYGTPEFYFDYY